MCENIHTAKRHNFQLTLRFFLYRSVHWVKKKKINVSIFFALSNMMAYEDGDLSREFPFLRADSSRVLSKEEKKIWPTSDRNSSCSSNN